MLFHLPADASGGLAVVGTEQTTEPFTSPNEPDRAFWHPIDQFVAQALMCSLKVIVLHVLANRPTKVPLTDEHHPIKAL